jgi:hypothetical protein
MFRKFSMTAIIVICVTACSYSACLEMGANFWNLGWGWGADKYCTGGVWGNWSTTFINQIQIYKVLRFMDWNAVNETQAGSWASRTPKSAGCTECSVDHTPIAYEWQIDVVNKVPGCGYWINVPCKADSTYVTSLAVLVHSLLSPGRKVYLEYANETWWEPASFAYVQSVGTSLNLPSINGTSFTPEYLGHTYCAVQMWHWFRKSWKAAGGDSTLVNRVLAGWQSSTAGVEAHYMLEAMLNTKVNPYGEKCDYFAIAPYFDCANPTGTQTQVLQHYKWTLQYGANLCCYEGGPSGICDTAHMTAYFTMLAKYMNGPYNQYCHSGGQWGAVENGYYQALANWSKTQPCNPTMIQEQYRVVAPANAVSQTVFSRISSKTGLYGIDGRRMELQSAKAGKPGCYVSASPKSGYNLILNMK